VRKGDDLVWRLLDGGANALEVATLEAKTRAVIIAVNFMFDGTFGENTMHDKDGVNSGK